MPTKKATSKASSVKKQGIKAVTPQESSVVAHIQKRAPRRVSATTKEFQDKASKLDAPRARAATAPSQKVYGTIGSMTMVNEKGEIVDDRGFYNKLKMARSSGSFNKTASMFGDSGLGHANVADSGNLQSFNFEFPNDALEQAQSRREELRYFRIAYDRDPIVNRAINLHTELPLSKLILEKPKCSVDSFADYVFDWFQGWTNEVDLFGMLLHGTREHFLSGEAYFFIEHDDKLDKFPLCPVAKRTRRRSGGPTSESHNPAEGADELSTYRWVAPKRSSMLDRAASLGLFDKTSKKLVDLDQHIPALAYAIVGSRKKLARIQALKTAKRKTSAPGDDTQKPMMQSPLERLKDMRGDGAAPDITPDGETVTGDGDEAVGDPSTDLGGDLGGEDAGGGLGGDMGGGMPGGLGGGMPGGLGGMDDPMGGGSPDEAQNPESQQLMRYLKQLEEKKSLLEELKAIKEEKQKEMELFSHVVNPDYWGPDRIVLLPPDVIEIKRDKRFNGAATICYRPSEEQKESYLDDEDVDESDKEMLEEDGIVTLNEDPLVGSYVLQFARKKAPFEDHGRSILQCCMRTIIYRDKLRQAQNTLISRNMTPKTLVVAPDAPIQELDALRVHVDEAKSDPDYTIVVNYEVTWNEIGTDGRLLALDSEWSHTNAELAVGVGFTPEILTGEGLFSGDRIRIEILNTTYTQFRDVLSELVEKKIFRPIAMRKGFYEVDDYGNPRWIYPKLNFSRLALRDQGDVYDMLFNLYSKGSLPVDIIYDFLNIDGETCKRKLEEDILTVKDSKFNQILDSIYSGGVAEALMKTTDLPSRVAKALGLISMKSAEVVGPEGTGEGV